MRREPTVQEARLWSRLRNKQLGVRFRRQEVILGWIVDFYCPAWKLAVEIDGPWHDPRADAFRDHVMAEHSIRVLRFTNDQVAHDLDGVVDSIRRSAAPYHFS